MEFSFVGCGFGDAIRICEHMKFANVKVAITFESLGNQVCENLNFIDKVIKLDEMRFWSFFKECPKNTRFCMSIQNHIFKLKRSDLKIQTCKYDLKDFIAVQPSTTLFKKLSLPVEAVPDNCVLFGSEEDKKYFPSMGLDLRGKLTVPEAMYLVSQCKFAIGIESWLVSLAGCFSIPSTMYCVSLSIHGEKWKRGWPTVEFKNV
jgi:hypothetical protein